MTDSDDLLTAALTAAGRGWPVFPLRPGGKTPALRGWPDRASTDTDRIRRWWSYNRRFNVAIATGPAGLHVIDLDSAHLRSTAPQFDDALGELAARLHQPPPRTFTIATPGGWHLYYRAPTQPRLACTVARLGPGIDTRGHGGYVVAAGSRTPAGEYRMIDARPIIDLPAALITALTPPPVVREVIANPAPVRPQSYLAAILAGEADRVARAQPGTRNLTLFRSALVLGRLIGAAELDEHHARAVLADAAHAHIGVDGFTAAELDRTVSNGFRYGTQRPRRIR
ncbi:bifunctional DNA primase/polymerase [Nocardia wallacei]|uniref:bifunctional DNA primase/polymerase n=1 Tax=Nocardia wallacei TaxID=480035 RepID=UPI002454A2F0|nr:bifunctional DNA primase/polymerase [Nocardia wallacei]